MADMSLLGELIDNLSATFGGLEDAGKEDQALIDRIGPMAATEARGQELFDVLGQGIEDVGAAPAALGNELLHAPEYGTDTIDALSERILGEPLILPRNEFGATPSRPNMFAPVNTGVSEGEIAKADLKTAEAHANVMNSAAALQNAKVSKLQSRLDALRAISSAADKDTFVAKGSTVLGGPEDEISKGSFSKTGKGYQSPTDLQETKVKQEKLSSDAGKSEQQKLYDTVLEIVSTAKNLRDPAAVRQALFTALSAKGFDLSTIKRVLDSKALTSGEQ